MGGRGFGVASRPGTRGGRRGDIEIQEINVQNKARQFPLNAPNPYTPGKSYAKF
jgi:hypothetical protein